MSSAVLKNFYIRAWGVYWVIPNGGGFHTLNETVPCPSYAAEHFLEPVEKLDPDAVPYDKWR